MASRTLLLMVVALLAAGCGDDPVSYSEPVGITLSVASGDVDNGALLDEKNINTESGNPYGAFASTARERIGGTPSSIELEAATLEIVDSTGVTTLAEIFSGDVDITFVTNGSSTAYPVATRTILADEGAGPVELTVELDSDTFSDADYAELADGSFKVVLSGLAAASFPNASADADLSVVMTFTAYE